MTESCPYKIKCKGVDCEQAFCMRRYKLDGLFANSLLTETQKKHKVLCTDADGTDIPEFTRLLNIEKYIDIFVERGTNLYLHSYTCGNGKTSWAIRLMCALFYKIWHKSNFSCQALFISVPRYLLALKDNISGHNEYAEFVNKHVLDAPLVVWDDIATKVGTGFELDHLLSIINTRLDAGKSNIFTSNLGKREIANALGERLASRICNKSIDIELRGADKRQLDVQ